MKEDLSLEEEVAVLGKLKLTLWEKQQIFDMENAELVNLINELEAVIKEKVLEAEKTVKTDTLTVSWCKGKTRWDSKLLTEYAKEHSDVMCCKVVDDPTVIVRLNPPKEL